MIGAIIGDIVGSVYWFDGIKTKDFPLFGAESSFTENTVMTVAAADALLKGGKASDFVDSTMEWSRRYTFDALSSIDDELYGFDIWEYSMLGDKYFNGSPMRVSPCAWFAHSLMGAEALAERFAAVTHDHPDGTKGARATTAAIWLARTESKQKIKEYIEGKYGYDLSRRLDDIRPNDSGYYWDCSSAVSAAIIAFLESDGFEDAIRNAVSLGVECGLSLPTVTGAIAEAFYGIPSSKYISPPVRTLVTGEACYTVPYVEYTHLATKTFGLLGDPLASVINAWLDAGLDTGLDIMEKDKDRWDREMQGFSKPHTIRPGEEMRLGEAEFAAVRLGFNPHQMEDKWLIFFDDGKLSCHRSWTGHKIYEAAFKKIDSFYVMDELVVERDQKIYRRTDDVEDFASFCFLVHGGLLGKRPKEPRGEDAVSMLRDWSEFGKLSVQS